MVGKNISKQWLFRSVLLNTFSVSTWCFYMFLVVKLWFSVINIGVLDCAKIVIHRERLTYEVNSSSPGPCYPETLAQWSNFLWSISRSVSPGSASTDTASLSGVTNTASRSNSLPRPTSPSPSVVSEKAEAELQVCSAIDCQCYVINELIILWLIRSSMKFFSVLFWKL